MPKEDVLEKLRDATKEAAKEGYYGDYLVAVVHILLLNMEHPMNPDDERQKRES